MTRTRLDCIISFPIWDMPKHFKQADPAQHRMLTRNRLSRRAGLKKSASRRPFIRLRMSAFAVPVYTRLGYCLRATGSAAAHRGMGKRATGHQA